MYVRTVVANGRSRISIRLCRFSYLSLHWTFSSALSSLLSPFTKLLAKSSSSAALSDASMVDWSCGPFGAMLKRTPPSPLCFLSFCLFVNLGSFLTAL